MRNRRLKIFYLVALALIAAPNVWQDARTILASARSQAEVAWLSVFLSNTPAPASAKEVKLAACPQQGAEMASNRVSENGPQGETAQDNSASALASKPEARTEGMTAAVRVPEEIRLNDETEWVGRDAKSQHRGFPTEPQIALNMEAADKVLQVEKLRELARVQAEFQINERALARQLARASSVAERLPAAYHYSMDAQPLPPVRTERVRVPAPTVGFPAAPAGPREFKIYLKPKKAEGTRRTVAPKVGQSSGKDVSALS